MWFLPTYNRAKQCSEVLAAVYEAGCQTKGIVFVNGEDHDGYKKLCGPIAERLGWELQFSDSNLGCIGALNYLLKNNPGENFYGFISDDEFVKTYGFDQHLIKAAGDWNYSNGNYNDGNQRCQAIACFGGKLARAVGYIGIPECNHWFGFDDMWERMAEARACEKIFCHDVLVEHKHPYIGNGEMDATYRAGESKKREDYDAYMKWMYSEDGLCAAINRIRKENEAIRSSPC